MFGAELWDWAFTQAAGLVTLLSPSLVIIMGLMVAGAVIDILRRVFR